MNKAVICGRWTADPKISYTQGNDPMCIARGTIAVDRRTNREGQKADFITVVAFGKIAEHVQKYYTKGMKANIAGHIQTGSYDHKDGYKVYTTDVVIDEIEFGESKKAQDDAMHPQTQAQKEDAQTPTEQWMDVPDEIEAELPFN